MVKKIIYVILCIAVLATGCGNKPEPVKQAEKAPHVSTEARATESDKNKIKKEDLNIDGIYMDQSMSEVFARYGKPDRIEHGVPVGRICIYNINGGELRVSATSAEESGTVEGVSVTGDTGLTTKGGIRVGNILNEVTKIYGNEEPSRYINSTGVEGANQILWYSAKIKRDANYYLLFYLDDNKRVVSMAFFREHSCE